MRALSWHRRLVEERNALPAVEPVAKPAKPARLLLLACSATKDAAPGLLPVRQRYTGPLWQTLAATDPAGALAQVVVLSAQLGFLPEWSQIPHYELRMSAVAGQEIAEQIRRGASGFNLRARGEAERRLHARAKAAQSASWAISDAYRAARQPLQEVAVVGGKDYLPAMLAAVAQAQLRGWVAPDAVVTVVNDQVGYMRQQLRCWLEGRPLPAKKPRRPKGMLGHNGGPALEELAA